MNIVIIGSAGHINYVFEGIREDPDARIVGIAPGPDGEKIDKLRERAAAEGHAPEEFADYREMLDVCRPDVAAVACYFGHHAEVNVEVLNRGIHLFAEKPVATTFEGLERVREAWNKSGAHLCAMFGIRYKPEFLTAWHAVRDGAIGEVRLMHAQKSYRLGTRPEHFRRRDLYGGTIPWVGSHAIDWVHWMGGKRFVSVRAMHSTRHNRGHGELEMSALCQFACEDEVMASVSIDYLRPSQAPTHADDRIRLAGTDGVLEVRDGEVFLINRNVEGSVQHLPLRERKFIFADYLGQVRGEGTCLVSAEESLYITEACLKARQSADERKEILF